MMGRTATELNAYQKKLVLDNGDTVTYDKCLLATGGTPKCPPVFEEASEAVKKRVILYRRTADYRRLQEVIIKQASKQDSARVLEKKKKKGKEEEGTERRK
jgi:NAD(P)H-nitrite reductase large subunit